MPSPKRGRVHEVDAFAGEQARELVGQSSFFEAKAGQVELQALEKLSTFVLVFFFFRYAVAVVKLRASCSCCRMGSNSLPLLRVVKCQLAHLVVAWCRRRQPSIF